MSQERLETLTGAVFLCIAVAFSLYAVAFSGAVTANSYALTASFRSIEGVSLGSNVRMAGVSIGSVEKITLNPQNFSADVTLMIQDNIILPQDSTAVIASEGLLGGSFVEVQPGGAMDNLAPGDSIENTQSSISFLDLLAKFVGGSGSGSNE